ncbi:hypothetical protein ACOMHN_015678 [Nucella lapillus]
MPTTPPLPKLNRHKTPSTNTGVRTQANHTPTKATSPPPPQSPPATATLHLDLERQLALKDDKIRELQRLVVEKDEKIQLLNSKLDKFQSVLPQAQTSMIAQGPRKQRAQGISAEPQAMNFSLQDMAASKLKRFSKTER